MTLHRKSPSPGPAAARLAPCWHPSRTQALSRPEPLPSHRRASVLPGPRASGLGLGHSLQALCRPRLLGRSALPMTVSFPRGNKVVTCLAFPGDWPSSRPWAGSLQSRLCPLPHSGTVPESPCRRLCAPCLPGRKVTLGPLPMETPCAHLCRDFSVSGESFSALLDLDLCLADSILIAHRESTLDCP